MSLPPSFRQNLTRRALTALVATPAVLAVFLLGAPALSVVLVGVCTAGALLEYFALLARQQLAPPRVLGFLLAIALYLEFSLPAWGQPPLWPIALVLLLAGLLRPGAGFPTRVLSGAATVLGAVYLGVLGGMIAGLRTIPPVATGPWRIAMLLIVIISADSFAYLVGHSFGRHKLAPAISPGKTREGAVAGIVGGVVGALLIRWLGLPQLPLADTVVLGAAVAAVGTVGDLYESVLKRWAGVKDSGTFFPGHGGMLDRMDSLLFGAPVLYYYFLYR